MRRVLASTVFLAFTVLSLAQQSPSAPAASADAKPAPTDAALPMPANPKALKEFDEGNAYLKQRRSGSALESFKKSVKIEPDCLRCGKAGIKLAMSLGNFKDAWEMAEMLGNASTDERVKGYAQYAAGVAMYREGSLHNKRDLLEKAAANFDALLATHPSDATVLLASGKVYSHLNQDDKAKERYEQYLKVAPTQDAERSRVERYLDHPELARARLAPNFRVTTLDGRTLDMDDLQGKVVLIDFWATWCGPCNEELPHVKEIAAKYAGRPLVVLSVSWDKDEDKWKQFVAAHGMTWAQYRDADHSLTSLFSIDAIPHYFTIDADSVLQSEQLGAGSQIDGKLKKMVAEAEKRQAAATTGGG